MLADTPSPLRRSASMPDLKTLVEGTSIRLDSPPRCDIISEETEFSSDLIFDSPLRGMNSSPCVDQVTSPKEALRAELIRLQSLDGPLPGDLFSAQECSNNSLFLQTNLGLDLSSITLEQTQGLLDACKLLEMAFQST